MNALFLKVKRMCKRALHFLPSPLPIGMSAHDAWAKDIIETYGMPDNDSTRQALAVAIMHQDATSAYKPKRYFGLVLLKGAANEIAHAKMQGYQQKKLERIKAEATALGTANESQAKP